MHLLVNLSIKKSATTYVHHLLRKNKIDGLYVDPLKEIYVVPRNTEVCHYLPFEALDYLERDVDCAGNKGLSESDRRFLSQVTRWQLSHPTWSSKANESCDEALILERIGSLISSVQSDGYLLCDPNLQKDIRKCPTLFSTLKCSGHQISSFMISRDPPSRAQSYLGMVARRELELGHINANTLTSVLNESDTFLQAKHLLELTGVESIYVFGFHNLMENPYWFFKQLQEILGNNLCLTETEFRNVSNPNPGKADKRWLSQFDVAQCEISLKYHQMLRKEGALKVTKESLSSYPYSPWSAK